MKKIILLLLLWIIFFNRCDSNIPIIGKKTEKDSLYSKVTQMCYFANLLGGPSGYKIVDNNDGTVALVNYSTLGVDGCPPPFAKRESILSIQYYIKKCIQGQVYRQAQNDCKGTGTAANYYGAQKFQGCPTNNTACDDSSGNQSKTLSPARASCVNDKTVGRNWDNLDFTLGTSIYNLKDYLFSRSDEIPSSSTDYYWMYDFGSRNISNTGGSPAGPLNKNLYNYILCISS